MLKNIDTWKLTRPQSSFLYFLLGIIYRQKIKKGDYIKCHGIGYPHWKGHIFLCTMVFSDGTIGIDGVRVGASDFCVTKQTPNNSFTLTWHDAITDPPTEGGRYWCIVREIGDLSTSYFQWNCSYNPNDIPRWRSNGLRHDVIYWTEFAPMPYFIK